ncbi:MAG: class B sortase [Eubacteriales bacterium]|nr:class B sortase [Eubacteriales bacterium]
MMEKTMWRKKGQEKNESVARESRGVFLDSLDRATTEDLGAAAPVRKKRKKLINGLSDILLLLCIGVFCICAATLIDSALDARHAKELYNNLSEGLFSENTQEDTVAYYGVLPLTKDYMAPNLTTLTELLRTGISGAVSSQVPVTTTYNLQIERLKIRLQEMQAQNPDIYCYIRIEDTVISYPVVLGEDNDFYLVHDPINRGYLDHGSIFADWRCDRRGIEYNRNTVLYGHHMSTGLMFANLTKFNDEEFFRSHLIYLYTTNGLYVYQPFSFFKTDKRHQYFRVIFDSEEDYNGFLQEMKACSQFETDIELTPADRILTLSTCTNITTSGRYCLQAKLIRIEK